MNILYKNDYCQWIGLYKYELVWAIYNYLFVLLSPSPNSIQPSIHPSIHLKCTVSLKLRALTDASWPRPTTSSSPASVLLSTTRQHRPRNSATIARPRSPRRPSTRWTSRTGPPCPRSAPRRLRRIGATGAAELRPNHPVLVTKSRWSCATRASLPSTVRLLRAASSNTRMPRDLVIGRSSRRMCLLLLLITAITTTRSLSRPRGAREAPTAVAVRAARTAVMATRCWILRWWSARDVVRSWLGRRSASTSSGLRSKRRRSMILGHWNVRSVTRDSMGRIIMCSFAWTTSATTCVTPTRTVTSRADLSLEKKSSQSMQSGHQSATRDYQITTSLRMPTCHLHQWTLSRWQIWYRLPLSKSRKTSSRITVLLLQWSKISRPVNSSRISSTRARFYSRRNLWTQFRLLHWMGSTLWWRILSSRHTLSLTRPQTIPKIKAIRRKKSTKKKKKEHNKLLISKTRSNCSMRES